MGAHGGMQAGQIPRYFVEKKEQFMQQMQQMGFDLYQVQDWLMTRGICEAQPNIVLDNINNPNYVNVLKPAAPVMPAPVQQMFAPQGGVNQMVNQMGQQMMGQFNNAMAAAGQPVNYNYQPQR